MFKDFPKIIAIYDFGFVFSCAIILSEVFSHEQLC